MVYAEIYMAAFRVLCWSLDYILAALTVAGIFKDCKGSFGGGLLFVVHAGFIMKLVCEI